MISLKAVREDNSRHNYKATPPRAFLPVVEKLKEAYSLWQRTIPHLQKTTRYSVGVKVDATILDAAESALTAGFLEREEKLPYLRRSIAKTDIALFLLQTMWENGTLSEKNYLILSITLIDAGKMLGGWRNQIRKQTSPTPSGKK